MEEVNWKIFENRKKLHFVGFEDLRLRCNVVGVVNDPNTNQDSTFHVLLDFNPFFPGSAGMLGDEGVLRRRDGSVLDVESTLSVQGIGVLVCTHVRDGDGNFKLLAEGTEVEAVVDVDRREKLAIHNTASHILHAALREVLTDEDIRVVGLLSTVQDLHLDVAIPRELTAGEITTIENKVNKWISSKGSEVVSRTMWFKEAKQRGAVYDKEVYGDVEDMAVVRVCQVMGVTMELCHGTHVHHTSEIGTFRVTEQRKVSGTELRIVAACSKKAAK